MSVKILEVKKESFPASRFIGKKYTQSPNWGEWWENDWFSVLEKNERLLNNSFENKTKVLKQITTELFVEMHWID